MAGESNLKILLVEDDPEDVRLIRQVLSGMKGVPFVLHVVDKLSLALERLKEDRLDLLLLDLSLPDGRGMHGIEKICGLAPSIPILVLNVMDSEDLGLQAIREGAQDYLVKDRLDSRSLKQAILFAVERKTIEKKLARLASFAWQNKNAIFETDLDGRITYLNPAGQRLFPELASRETEHPLLEGLGTIVNTLQKERKEFVIRDLKIGDRFYEQHISYVPENEIIRSYIADDTERKRAEESLRLRTEEVERMNRVMLGREIKIIELKQKVKALEGGKEIE